LSATGGEMIEAEHLPELEAVGLNPEELSAERIRASMAKAGGVVAHASAMLGVSRTTFYNALKRLNLDTASLRR
jgi:transcriptional regulator of acetoin/glycerol metabolism